VAKPAIVRAIATAAIGAQRPIRTLLSSRGNLDPAGASISTGETAARFPGGLVRGRSRSRSAGVARDFPKVVQHRQVRARHPGHAYALDEPRLVGAGKIRGQVVEAEALDLDVAGEDAVARQDQVPRTLEELLGPLEQLADLA
jgi:hypothetical protein